MAYSTILNEIVFGLEHIQGTVKFTMRFNDLFDALNRRFPTQGTRRDSKDFEVLKSFLTWLDSWETQVAAGRIPKERFLTVSTAEGLRVTVMSTIELTTLLEVCDCKYVLQPVRFGTLFWDYSPSRGSERASFYANFL